MNSSIKDHDILRYYEAEMRYLREAGKEFAQAYPDRARMLNIDRVGDRDPHVERLFEGFAFLMGRLRHKLDDELPELTEGLVSMLWPHYLRMIPSLSILELTPDFGSVQQHEVAPAGLEVLSEPVGEHGVECVYRSTQDVDLYPLRLVEAAPSMREDGRSVIRLRLALQEQLTGRLPSVPRLRFYLHGERPLAMALYKALTAPALKMQVRVPGFPEYAPGAPQAMPGLRFEAAGFADDERLWPKADNAFGGYQLLLEYFTFPEKFMFVDLLGLQLQALPSDIAYIDVEVVLEQSYPDDMRFSAENLRLYCTPIVNLFQLEADPISATHLATEYRVNAMAHHGANVEVYSVESVRGFEAASGNRFEYAPFAAFRHRGGMLRHQMPERYFHTRMRRGPSGRFDAWLVLGGHVWEQQERLPAEVLSLSVIGTNGMLPRKALREASIGRMRSSVSNVAEVRNLTAPSLPMYPPTGDRFQWRVLSHLAPNYLSLLDAEVLRGTLALYDWTDGEMNRRRIEAIRELRHRPLQKMVSGALMRGVEIEITLQPGPSGAETEVELFGEVLNRFFAAYAPLNLFIRLVLVMQASGRRIEWAPATHQGAPF